MMNRRQFVGAATGAAIFVRIPNVLAARAAKYDLIVKGGRVIDPSRKLNAKDRSEEHTSELQSRPHLVCRLLLEKKKTRTKVTTGFCGFSSERSHLRRVF